MKLSFLANKKRAYLDYAAASPLRPVVTRAVSRHEKALFANPSSIHSEGLHVSKALEDARLEIARLVSAHSDEIIFTAGGTESNAIAIEGVYEYARTLPQFEGKTLHIVTTAIEHPSVLETCRILETKGVRVTYLQTELDGLVSLKNLREALCSETILVSLGYANNEIGVIQPIREIAKTIRSWKKHSNIEGDYPLLHTDACQAAGYLDMNVERLGVDLMTWNSVKVGGPHGVGALYVSRTVPIAPLYGGGGQERNLRSGTQNVAGILGFESAFKEARAHSEKESSRLCALRDFCMAELIALAPDVRINGSVLERLPNNINVSFEKFSSELLVVELDARGVSVSAGSACGSMKGTGSHVIASLYGNSDEKSYGTIRISMGWNTKKQDIQKLLLAFKNIFEKYSKAGIL